MMNSGMNPIIYAFQMPRLKQEFGRILPCCCGSPEPKSGRRTAQLARGSKSGQGPDGNPSGGP